MSKRLSLGFRVLGSKILVEPRELNNKVEGTNLIVPEQILKKERIIEGLVVGLGSDVVGLEVGDRIMYERFTAQEVELGDGTYHIVGNVNMLHGVYDREVLG